MKNAPYKSFSLRTHLGGIAANKASLCQFELTFACSFKCPHCYTSCYNKAALIRKELKLRKIKKALDKLAKEGVLWLCLTGGDPLMRPDFKDIYLYARSKGFIVTISTNGFLLDEKLTGFLVKNPPFCIEITLNAATKIIYEKMSGVKGTFEPVLNNIAFAKSAGLPLRMKTLVTRQNIAHLEPLRAILKKHGLKFWPDCEISPRLDGDTRPCLYRVNAKVMAKTIAAGGFVPECANMSKKHDLSPKPELFQCAIMKGDFIHLDPYGKISLCSFLRRKKYDFLKYPMRTNLARLKKYVKKLSALKSECTSCGLRELCLWCPAKAMVEAGNPAAPLRYYCRAARALAEKNGRVQGSGKRNDCG